MGYYLERFSRSLLTLVVTASITFGIIRLMPGGPLTKIRVKLAKSGASPEKIHSTLRAYRARMNLDPDASLPRQYLHYLSSLAHGDLGTALQYTNAQGDPQTVTSLVGQYIPWTVFLMVIATILIFAIAIIWGAFVAYKEGSVFDKISSAAGVLLGSIPFYVMAFILLAVFAFSFKIFPARGKMTPLTDPRLTVGFFVDVFMHALLPIASLVIVQSGLQMLAMRGNSIQVLGEDYVRVARLRGLSDLRISSRYVARNAILPMYTGFLTLIAFNIGGSVILEQVFQYHGIGWLMFDSLEIRDYSVLMGVFLVLTLALVLSLLIADMTYSWVDPRVKSGEASEAY